MQSPLCCSGDADWKLDYCNPDRLSPEGIRRLRTESDHARETARALREANLLA
jgi:hypothetical protein